MSLLYVCDHCGYSSDAAGATSLPSGWTEVESQDLCENCFDELKKFCDELVRRGPIK